MAVLLTCVVPFGNKVALGTQLNVIMAFTYHFISFFFSTAAPDEQKEQEENTGQFTLLLPFMKEVYSPDIFGNINLV